MLLKAATTFFKSASTFGWRASGGVSEELHAVEAVLEPLVDALTYAEFSSAIFSLSYCEACPTLRTFGNH